jgi:hypothetical protein
MRQPLRFLPFVTDGGTYRVRWSHAVLDGDPLASDFTGDVFQLDCLRDEYLEVKRNIANPRLEMDLGREVEAQAREFAIRALCRQYPDVFPEPRATQASLDEIALSIQEDLAIVSVRDGRNWLSYLHVCIPSGWRPEDKIGKSFDAIHAPVPGREMTRIRESSQSILEAKLANPRVEERFVWGLQTEPSLDRHPDRSRRPDFAGELWLRVERQVLVPLRPVSAFLFVIRPYVHPVAELAPAEVRQLESAVESMSAELAEYKEIARSRAAILAYLSERSCQATRS